MIRIVTDSVSDLPEQFIKELDITVLPLTVNFNDGSYRDGVDLSVEEFYKKMSESETLPTTSQVTPGNFLNIFEEIVGQGDEILAILMSSELSGTYNAAILAKEMLGKGTVEIIDSRGVTFGYGLFVIEAARMVKNGHTMEEIKRRVLEMRDNIEYKFIVDTLENLYKGGRLSATGAIVGKLLNIKPILTMRDGKLVVEERARGKKKAIKWVVDWIAANNIDLSNQTIGINHSNDPEFAEELIHALEEHFQIKEIIRSKVGCVVGTHAGPGAAAVYFFRQR